MAIIDLYFLAPGIGSVWSWALSEWVDRLKASTPGLTAGLTTAHGLRGIKVQWTAGSDTIVRHFCAADISSSTALIPLPYVLTSPGWRTCPPQMFPEYGGVNSKTAFEATMHAVRGSILTDWCGATVQETEIVTNTFTEAPETTVYHYVRRLKARFQLALDAYVLLTWSGAAPWNYLGGAPPTDGMIAGQPSGSIASGVGEVQFSELIGAVQDVAMVDVDYTANQGRAVFSMRGRVNVGS